MSKIFVSISNTALKFFSDIRFLFIFLECEFISYVYLQ